MRLSLCRLKPRWPVSRLSFQRIYNNVRDPNRLRDISGCRRSRTSVVGEHEVPLVGQTRSLVRSIAGVEMRSYTKS